MDVFSMNFGRTEVIIGASKAKFCRESFGEVRFCVAPQKPGKNKGTAGTKIIAYTAYKQRRLL